MTSHLVNNPTPLDDDNEPLQVVFANDAPKSRHAVFARLNPRLPLVAMALIALLAAIWGGLIRAGWAYPPLIQILPAIHGPLMLVGFLGTLISIERAVALQLRWAYLAPLLSGVSTFVLFLDLNHPSGILLAALSSIALLMIFAVIVNRHFTLYTGTMALGAVVWMLGNLIWLAASPVGRIVNWWAGFLILTIVGERLELSRVQRFGQRTFWLYAIALGTFLTGLVWDALENQFDWATMLGARGIGVGMIALAVWLIRFDLARRNIRQQGLTRFIAVCLLLGYIWLAVSGVLRLYFGTISGGFIYDAILHTLFLGFVVSMIFGHAPIILPSILGRAILYRSRFYLHLILLHLSLGLRVVGDLTFDLALRQWGAMLNAIAILLFLFNTLSVILQSIRTRLVRE